ncbi:MAG: putative transcriptional regulator [Firmicutes bacterium]|nr:putative transcriptional regulator [Bacillota bacterium]
MRIRELSQKTGASMRSLRYYETKQLLVAKRLENKYREYDESAIETVKTIQFYLSIGLNTDDIAQVLECPITSENRPLCKVAYELYKSKLSEVNKQLNILNKVKLQLQERISEFEKL